MKSNDATRKYTVELSSLQRSLPPRWHALSTARTSVHSGQMILLPVLGPPAKKAIGSHHKEKNGTERSETTNGEREKVGDSARKRRRRGPQSAQPLTQPGPGRRGGRRGEEGGATKRSGGRGHPLGLRAQPRRRALRTAAFLAGQAGGGGGEVATEMRAPLCGPTRTAGAHRSSACSPRGRCMAGSRPEACQRQLPRSPLELPRWAFQHAGRPVGGDPVATEIQLWTGMGTHRKGSASRG